MADDLGLLLRRAAEKWDVSLYWWPTGKEWSCEIVLNPLDEAIVKMAETPEAAVRAALAAAEGGSDGD